MNRFNKEFYKTLTGNMVLALLTTSIVFLSFAQIA